MRILVFVAVLFFGAEALASLSVSPSNVNFSRVEVGGFGPSQSVWVRNMSDEDVNINVSHSCFSDFSVSNTCFQLRRHGSCTIRVRYRPMREGYDRCSINITSRGSRTDFKTVNVSGRAVSRRR